MPFNPVTPSPKVAGQDLGVNNFGNVGGGITTQTVISDYDIYTPQEMIQLFDRHSYNPGWRLTMKAMGFSRGVAAPTTGHYEAPWKKDTITIGGVADATSAGPGNDIIITLAASSMYDAGVTVGGASRKASYPIVGDILKFNNGLKGQVISKDTSVDPHTIRVRPTKATYDITSSGDNFPTSPDVVFISDVAFAEGSGLPAGRTPRIIKYSNTFQIVKARYSVTGSEMTNQAYFNPVQGQQGGIHLKAEMDTYERFEDMCDGALLWGEQIDNITSAVPEIGFDVPVTGTEGFIDFSLTNGNILGYTPGSYDMGDFNSIGDVLEAERCGTRKLVAWQGREIYTEIEDLLQAQIGNDLTTQLSRQYFMGDQQSAAPMDEMQPFSADDLAFSIGFYAVKKAGYVFCFKKLHAFNEAVGAGASGYTWPGYQFIHPMGYTTNKSTMESVPTMGYEYKQQGSYSREMVLANLAGVGVAGTGGYTAMAVNDSDIKTMGLVSEIAFHGTTPNHIVVNEPT
jgi:hypothetical protein